MTSVDSDGYPIDPYNEVIPRLAQASSRVSPWELLGGHGFDVSFDVGGWDQSGQMAGLDYTFYLIDDVPWIEDPDAVHELGRRVADEVLAGRRVVVNCAAGLNRSGLIVGRALIHMGYRPREAVQLIRAARGRHALFNRTSRSSCCSTARTPPPRRSVA